MYCLKACVLALFSPEIVQAGAVKGLKGMMLNGPTSKIGV